MISTLFNTSASNFGHAAMRAVKVHVDTPIDMKLASHGPGEDHAYVEITAPNGFARQIPIDRSRLLERRDEDVDFTDHDVCQLIVDDLTDRIEAAVDEAVRDIDETPRR